MVAAAVLGIGLVGLVKLHLASVRGMVRSRDITKAHEVAGQIGDMMLARQAGQVDFGTFAACVNATPPPAVPDQPREPAGCRATASLSAQFAPPGPPGCTQWWSGAPVPDVSGVVQETNAAGQSGKYRVDTVIWPHPQADTAAANAQVMYVFVCWRDERGFVHEVQTRRLLVEGV